MHVWMLAARYKVASLVTGTPDLSGREDTWRDLVERMGTDTGRAEAEAAWQGVCGQSCVDAERVQRYVRTALEHMAQAPGEPHHARSLLAPAEIRYQLHELCGPPGDLPDRGCHELIQDQVRARPDAVAAVHGSRSWTYATLDAHADRIACSLRRRGLRAEDVVAVVMRRSLEWLATVLGVFKAGGCCLPLAPGAPAGQVAAVVERSGCRWMVADPGVPRPTRTVGLSCVEELLAGDRDADPGPPVGADRLAYICATDGAMCEHRGLLNHLLAKTEDLGIGVGDVVAQTAPACSGGSLWQLLSPLLVGGHTHIVEEDDVHRFLDTLAAGRVGVVQLTPSYLGVMLTALAERPRALPALRVVSVTGEVVPTALARRWFTVFPRVPLVNAYGRAETCGGTHHELRRRVRDTRSVPIGRPIRNARVYLVDQRLRLVPIGAPGEIVFSGVCVGRGYLDDPVRTAVAFGEDPYRPGHRLYRTGDIGRWLPSRSLELIGRGDSHVGADRLRIEIGEIDDREVMA